jgi:hypothetical protein
MARFVVLGGIRYSFGAVLVDGMRTSSMKIDTKGDRPLTRSHDGE